VARRARRLSTVRENDKRGRATNRKDDTRGDAECLTSTLTQDGATQGNGDKVISTRCNTSAVFAAGSGHIGLARHMALAGGLLLLASTCGIWRQTNPGMGSRNQDNIAINLRTMAKSRLDGLVEGNRQGMIPCR